MATLTLQLPNLPPVEHVLNDNAITIGRMKGNTITLEDGSVSLTHAVIKLQDGGHFLKDLNSTNGTMVNGQSVAEVQLHDGDQVKFGEVSGRFHSGSAPAPRQAAAPVVPNAPVKVAIPPPASPSAPTQVLPHAMSTEPPAKKSFWPLLALKIIGLTVIGLALWKFVFNVPHPTGSPTSPDASSTSSPVKADSPKTPPVVVSPQIAGTASNSLSDSNSSPVEITASQRLAALVETLKSSDVQERRRAVAALNAMQGDALPAVPALREVLKDSDSEVRTWAALSLISNQIYDKATVPILIEALQHENPTLRQVACLSLALIPLEETEKEPVITALTECSGHDTNADVRNTAVSALKMITRDSVPVGK